MNNYPNFRIGPLSYDYYLTRDEEKQLNQENRDYTKGTRAHMENGQYFCNAFELIPCRSQKSFGGRAIVIETEKSYFLKSYNTIACEVIKADRRQFVRHWPEWSATTAKHVESFLYLFGYCGVCKKEWLNIPVDVIVNLDNVARPLESVKA